jgi:hypothetical protein
MFDRCDPKLAWALANRALFPLDVNTAPREMLLRVPGLGVRAVEKIVASRRHARLRFADLARLTSSARKIAPFIVTPDHRRGARRRTARRQARAAGRAAEPAVSVYPSASGELLALRQAQGEEFTRRRGRPRSELVEGRGRSRHGGADS